MLRTITIGSCVSVQGIFVEDMPDGRIAVKVDETVYAGRPISTKNGPRHIGQPDLVAI